MDTRPASVVVGVVIRSGSEHWASDSRGVEFRALLQKEREREQLTLYCKYSRNNQTNRIGLLKFFKCHDFKVNNQHLLGM